METEIEFFRTWPTTESSFIMAIAKPEGVMNIGPFFATSKYFQSCSLPVVFVDVVPSDDGI